MTQEQEILIPQSLLIKKFDEIREKIYTTEHKYELIDLIAALFLELENKNPAVFEKDESFE